MPVRTDTVRRAPRNSLLSYNPINAKIHYTSFPVTSPQQVRNIKDKFVTSWCGHNSVVSVSLSCRFPISITTTRCQRVAKKSATSPQQVGNFPVYTGKLPGNVCNGFGALLGRHRTSPATKQSITTSTARQTDGWLLITNRQGDTS